MYLIVCCPKIDKNKKQAESPHEKAKTEFEFRFFGFRAEKMQI